MIRRAAPSDIPRLLVMGRDFWNQTPWRVLGEFNEESSAAAFRAFMAGETTALFVIADETDSAVGAFGVLRGPSWMTGREVAQELFWWVEPQAAAEALALWKTGEAWAADHGAVISMVRLDGLRDEALHRLYQRRGYRVMEHTYLKVA